MTVDKNQIGVLVRRHIAAVAALSEDDVTDSLRFREDLGLGDYMKAALARGFQRIAREKKADAKITIKECKKLKTVSKAVTLVFERAGGTK